MNLKYDASLIYKANIGENGINITVKTHQRYAKDFSEVTNNIIKNEYGFIKVIKDKKVVKQTKAAYEEIEKWAKTLVVIGIGGSDLGGRMLKQALQADKPPMQVIFLGDTTDPEQYRQAFNQLDPQATIVNVISKSGSTTETVTGYLLLKKFIKNATQKDWSKHFIFTTSSGSILYKEAQKHKMKVLEHDDVGGRYSVLSKVGLFPALAMGIDIDKLITGACYTLEKLPQLSQSHNIAWQIALTQYLFWHKKKISTVVLMPYIWRLSLFGDWFRQLWAESLGKKGKGIMPIKAIGPADQHSQLQFYAQGEWLSTFIFIKARHYSSEYVVQSEDIEELSHLHFLPVEDIIKFECDATRLSLASSGRPSATLEIDSLDEQHLGSLIAIFELSVVYLAKLFKVDPFDQPGVEASKEYLYGLLGKNEYHKKAVEIKKKQDSTVEHITEIN
jgi:glucose-6-phosphate isomerase